MPDICMCYNSKCSQRSKCYRYRAWPEALQNYSYFKEVDGKCDHFMPVEKREVIDIQKCDVNASLLSKTFTFME